MVDSNLIKPQKKILIIGGNGLFSFNFLYLLKDSIEIHCLTRGTGNHFEEVRYHQFESYNDLIALEDLITEINPTLIINSAGLTSVEKCESSPDLAFFANVVIPENLAKVSSRLGKKLVHISTDHFGASQIFEASEEQIEIPKNFYASTKLEADRRVIKENPDHLIIRTNFFGWGHSRRKSFSDFILEGGEKGNSLKLFYDVLFSPILVDDLIEDILDLVRKDARGVFNVVGNQTVTKYSFGKLLLQRFRLNDLNIEKDYLSKRTGLVPRPLDMSLSREKLNRIIGRKSERNLSNMFDRLEKSKNRREEFLSLT